MTAVGLFQLLAYVAIAGWKLTPMFKKAQNDEEGGKIKIENAKK